MLWPAGRTRSSVVVGAGRVPCPSVVLAVAVAPKVLSADDGMSVKGSIKVSAIVPSVTDYCAGGTPIEAQGVADISGLGPLYVTVKKCLTFPGGPPVGTWSGTLTLRASKGDTLTTAYSATEDFSLTDSNGFTPGQGTVTITGEQATSQVPVGFSASHLFNVHLPWA